MPEVKSQDVDREIEFIVKLHKDTQLKKILWKPIAPDVILPVKTSEKQVIGAFQTTYNGKTIRLSHIRETRLTSVLERATGISILRAPSEVKTTNDITLDVVGEHGYTLYSLFNVEGLRGLLSAVKGQILDLDEYIGTALGEEDKDLPSG